MDSFRSPLQGPRNFELPFLTLAFAGSSPPCGSSVPSDVSYSIILPSRTYAFFALLLRRRFRHSFLLELVEGSLRKRTCECLLCLPFFVFFLLVVASVLPLGVPLFSCLALFKDFFFSLSKPSVFVSLSWNAVFPPRYLPDPTC